MVGCLPNYYRYAIEEIQIMIIQIILSLIILLLISYSLYQGKRLLPWKLPFITALTFSLYFIWNPEHATSIANSLGVGRGADLLLYILIIANLIIITNVHNKFHEVNEINTKITRKISLLEQKIKETEDLN